MPTLTNIEPFAHSFLQGRPVLELRFRRKSVVSEILMVTALKKYSDRKYMINSECISDS